MYTSTPHCFFLGVPVHGGDYNEGEVKSNFRHFDAIKDAVIRIVERFPEYVARHDLNKEKTSNTQVNVVSKMKVSCECRGTFNYEGRYTFRCSSCSKDVNTERRAIHVCPDTDVCKDCITKGNVALTKFKKQCECNGMGTLDSDDEVECELCFKDIDSKQLAVHICPDIDICRKCIVKYRN